MTKVIPTAPAGKNTALTSDWGRSIDDYLFHQRHIYMSTESPYQFESYLSGKKKVLPVYADLRANALNLTL